MKKEYMSPTGSLYILFKCKHEFCSEYVVKVSLSTDYFRIVFHWIMLSLCSLSSAVTLVLYELQLHYGLNVHS
jgi:hypothetical protein